MAVAKISKSIINAAGVHPKGKLVAKGSMSGKKSSTIYTTVDHGRLHVGIDKNYLGSVNSYNNWFTRFFAGIFGWSQVVTINNKQRHVEKKDFIRLLNENGLQEAKVEDIKSFVDFNTLQVKATLNRGTLQQNISQEKAEKLFYKLVRALTQDSQDLDRAMKYVGKGANLEQQFWIRDVYGLSFTTLQANLPEDKSFEIDAALFTPLLYAAGRGNDVFSDFLRDYNANVDAPGQQVNFSRKILEVNPIVTIVKKEDFTSGDGRVITKVTVKTNTTLQIQDVQTLKYSITFNPDDNTLQWDQNKSVVVTDNYTRDIERYTTRYM